MTSLKRYSKAAAALLVGLAAAAALLPTDADPRLLAAGVVVNTLAVWATRNQPEPAPPTRYAREPDLGWRGRSGGGPPPE